MTSNRVRESSRSQRKKEGLAVNKEGGNRISKPKPLKLELWKKVTDRQANNAQPIRPGPDDNKRGKRGRAVRLSLCINQEQEATFPSGPRFTNISTRKEKEMQECTGGKKGGNNCRGRRLEITT